MKTSKLNDRVLPKLPGLPGKALALSTGCSLFEGEDSPGNSSPDAGIASSMDAGDGNAPDAGLPPSDLDTDGDGLTDVDEITVYGTSPAVVFGKSLRARYTRLLPEPARLDSGNASRVAPLLLPPVLLPSLCRALFHNTILSMACPNDRRLICRV